MKKIIIGVVLFIIIISTSIFVRTVIRDTYRDSQRKYSSMSGKDTIASFGNTDGRFEIFELYYDNVKTYTLCDEKTENNIDIVYKFKDIEPYVYSIGEKGYTKLNYENAEFIQSKDLKVFSKESQSILEELQNEKQDK
ncbi:MAG: hypothetical protein RR500_09035 [Bacilli bacterium]